MKYHTHIQQEKGRVVIVEGFNYLRIGQDYIKWRKEGWIRCKAAFSFNVFGNPKREKRGPRLGLNNA